ncbi:HpcH/HpaI aldolase/citrate lyase family protein [Geothrix sp. 21YS21S-2]|uniref:HpcH/HpaI aldolase family protein n=1 Tax=Geothrix sp. 21YS21S-2 TaxID=3068893 RepID=UPI0027BB015C|nr:aldolase/citrate lyase family protein [Geothrix sp. 21YS21S-2]
MEEAKTWLAAKPHRIGPFLRIPRPELVEMLGMAGFDFAILDLEHGPTAPADVYPLILAAERRGLRLLARIPALQESYFKWLLDLGVGGIQVPHVKCREDAERAVAYGMFAPGGERGMCRFVRAAEFSNIPKEDYIAEANRNRLLVLQIEGKEGLDHLTEIIEVPGIDVIFVGPYDLSQSLGLIGQIWHPEVVKAVEEVITLCGNKGVEVGVFTDTPEGLAHWKKLGVKYLAYRVETEILLNAFKSTLTDAHDALR